MQYLKKLSLTACALSLLAVPFVGTAVAQSADPVIKLLDAGKGEKRALRFKVTKGLKQTSEMIMKMGMETQVGPNKMPKMDLPGIKMGMTMEVTDVAADGGFSYNFKLDSAEPMKTTGPMAEMMMNAMKTALQGIVGMKGEGKMTNRGINRGMKLELPPQMDPQTRQMLDGMQDAMSRMSAPVPAEPIGVGGKWSVVQKLDQNGITLTQTATYTVKAFKGDMVELGVEMKMDAPKQEMKAPGMPPNVKVMLDSMTGGGKGDTTLEMSKVLPTKATADITTSMKANMDMAGQSQPMNMNMSMNMTINTK